MSTASPSPSGLPSTASPSTTAVSTPSTGRSPASSATERAFPRRARAPAPRARARHRRAPRTAARPRRRECRAARGSRAAAARSTRGSAARRASPLARPPDLLRRPLPRPPALREPRVAVLGPASGACSSTRSTTSSPDRRRSRIQSPWPRWNSTEVVSAHSTRWSPNEGRSSSRPGGCSSLGAVRIASSPLTRKTSSPPGAQQPGGLGDPGVRVGPEGRARTRRRPGRSSRPAAARPRRSPRAGGTRARSAPASARAVSSWAGVTSTPTGRAPRRASQAETYAVPQPSSTTSSPSTDSGSTRDLRLGDAPDAPR